MREIEVSGNLGADPEVLTTKNGENYVRMRLASHEFGDDEGETRWFDVVMFQTPKILPHLKKGSGIRIQGDYKDTIFNSDKYGPQINRSVIAYKIDFWSSGKREEQSENKTTSTVQTPEVKVEPVKASPAGPKSPAKPKAAAPKQVELKMESVSPSEDDTDDLPF